MNDELEIIEGLVESVTYQNTETGYTVLDFSTGDGELFTAVGTMLSLAAGEKVRLHGNWTVHASYGKQFKVESFEWERPKTVEDQYNYLASGAIKGIREGIARRLVEEFGEATFDVLENDPERLAKIKGISKERAKEISVLFKEQFAVREILIALEKYSMTATECLKLYNVLGARAVDHIERNPYILCDERIGIGFERAETIASKLPQQPDKGYRIPAGILYVIRRNLMNGHTCLPKEKLIPPCCDLLQEEFAEVEAAIDEMITKKQLVAENLYGRDFVFLPEMYKAELSAARNLLFFKRFPPSGARVTDEDIQKAEVIGGICYNEKQKTAIKTAVEQGLLILTGGPGTGKTTTLRAILRLFELEGLEVALAAPTGRAAKRMSELTGREAKTIHRLLEVEWDKNDRPVFQRNKRNPIDANAVIVDELSMVDISVFSSFLEALPIGCRLVMVGDYDQLPPVGPGNVLHDLIESGIMPIVKLDEVFRQAMESLIVTNAHKIVNGEMPDISRHDKDFFFMERPYPADAASTVGELCAKRLPDAYKYTPIEDIQVICPSRLGETGTKSLNKMLQQLLNPARKDKKEHRFGDRIFREGDKLMQIKNNYDICWESKTDSQEGMGVFNGDIGVLEKLDLAAGAMEIRFDDRVAQYPFEFSVQLEHAYAVTVHKSQGSEFKAVIIPMTGILDKLAYRNLLYTAVTRARELLIIVGSRGQLYRMVENNVKAKRYSALKSFLLTEGGDAF